MRSLVDKKIIKGKKAHYFLEYAIGRNYNKGRDTVSKMKKFSTFESELLYEDHYKSKVYGQARRTERYSGY